MAEKLSAGTVLRIEAALICRYAEPLPDGTAVLVGAGTPMLFSNPIPPEVTLQLPAGMPRPIGTPVRFYVVARVVYSRSEMNTPHSFQVRVADQDGTLVIPGIQMQLRVIDVPIIPPGGLLSTLVVSQNELAPPKFGTYGVDIIVDGDTKQQLQLQILPPPGMPGVPPAAAPQ